MPDIYVKLVDPRTKSPLTRTYLYRLIFPDGKIYIGCTYLHPVARVYFHFSKTDSRVSQAVRKYKELYVQILAIGSYEYITELETFAIKHFDSTNPEVGYNVSPGKSGAKIHGTYVQLASLCVDRFR